MRHSINLQLITADLKPISLKAELEMGDLPQCTKRKPAMLEIAGKQIPVDIIVPSLASYLAEESECPKLDLWDLQNKLKDQKIIGDGCTICGHQVNIEMLAKRQAVLGNPDLYRS